MHNTLQGRYAVLAACACAMLCRLLHSACAIAMHAAQAAMCMPCCAEAECMLGCCSVLRRHMVLCRLQCARAILGSIVLYVGENENMMSLLLTSHCLNLCTSPDRQCGAMVAEMLPALEEKALLDVFTHRYQ